MLVESKLAAVADDAEQFCEGPRRVPDGAQHQGGDSGVERGVVYPKALGETFNDTHGDRGGFRRPHGDGTKVGLWLRRHQLLHRARVMAEVRADSRAHFDDTTREPREQLSPVLKATASVVRCDHTREYPAREDRVAYRGLAVTHGPAFGRDTAAEPP